MYRIEAIGIVGAYGMGAATTAYVEPGDMLSTWGPILAATLLGATINVLWQIRKGGNKLDAAIAGLIAVMLGLFIPNLFGDVLQHFFPILRDASATAVAGAVSMFGVGYAMKLMDKVGRD